MQCNLNVFCTSQLLLNFTIEGQFAPVLRWRSSLFTRSLHLPHLRPALCSRRTEMKCGNTYQGPVLTHWPFKQWESVEMKGFDLGQSMPQAEDLWRCLQMTGCLLCLCVFISLSLYSPFLAAKYYISAVTNSRGDILIQSQHSPPPRPGPLFDCRGQYWCCDVWYS